MENSNGNNIEIMNLICISLKNYGADIQKIKLSYMKNIICDYEMFCYQFYCISDKELDIFEKAACLLVAINGGKLFKDNQVNAYIAVEVAFKMCENPFIYGFKKDNEELEEIDFKEIFKDDLEKYLLVKNELMDSLIYQKGLPWDYHLILKTTYLTALAKKYKTLYKQVNSSEPKLDIGKHPKKKNMVKHNINK